ncbi:hypothetical protein U0070_008824, partial [Myodes glareolus]
MIHPIPDDICARFIPQDITRHKTFQICLAEGPPGYSWWNSETMEAEIKSFESGQEMQRQQSQGLMYPGICQTFSATHPFSEPNIDLEQLTFSYRIVVSFPGLPLMDLSDLIPTFQSLK